MIICQSIKNNFIRLIPKINQHSDGFASAGAPEQRITNTVSGTGAFGASSNKDNNRTFFNYYNISCEATTSDTWTDPE